MIDFGKIAEDVDEAIKIVETGISLNALRGVRELSPSLGRVRWLAKP